MCRRDRDYAASLGIPHDRMTLSADPALLLTPADARRVDYILKNVENVPLFAVSLRSFATLRSEEAVSYTHLDVYKRQSQYRSPARLLRASR